VCGLPRPEQTHNQWTGCDKPEAICRGARLRLVGRTLAPGVVLRFAGKLPAGTATELTGPTRKPPGVTCARGFIELSGLPQNSTEPTSGGMPLSLHI
jgi:hypothetical protein